MMLSSPMTESPQLIALRRRLGGPLEGLPADIQKQMAVAAIDQVLDGVEHGVLAWTTGRSVASRKRWSNCVGADSSLGALRPVAHCGQTRTGVSRKSASTPCAPV